MSFNHFSTNTVLLFQLAITQWEPNILSSDYAMPREVEYFIVLYCLFPIKYTQFLFSKMCYVK